MVKEIFYPQIISFLKEKNPECKEELILPSTNLIYGGILDSFAVVELIIFIEKITNKQLDVDKLNTKSIETIENIYNYFINNSK